MTSWSLNRKPASVYLCRSAAGRLLYVGMTGGGVCRITAHARSADSSAWWPLGAYVEIRHCATRAEAFALELQLIGDMDPEFNRQRVRRAR
jgi:excinuclease UvrABC nuclease subunit